MAAVNTLKKQLSIANTGWSWKMWAYISHCDKNKDDMKCNTGSWTSQGTVNLTTNPQI